MKTRKLLIAVLVIALIAVYYILGTDYLKQHGENTSLTSSIAGATQTLAQIPLPPADLKDELDTAQENLDAARNELPDRLNSTRIIDTILLLADEIGIKAIPLVTQAWTIESFYEHSYSVFRFNINLTGTFAQLVEFSGRLEAGELETLVLEYLTVDRDNESEDTPDGVIPVKASLDIAIYSQAPATEDHSESEL